ncbi:MAG TPA: UbiD family decarboxylase, partial [Trebonia sp.]|nr:UbiD family decarboxylase [Trebonia sp.]
MTANDLDPERFRLRRLVEQLAERDEVEVHDEPVALADLSSVIEASPKAVLFRKAGPEQLELVAGVMGSRNRLAVALGVAENDSLREFERRLASPQRHFEVPSSDAPVHQVVLTGDDIDLTKLPFYLQHDLDGGPYISSAIDFSVDPASGRHNVGCRRLMLRGRKHLRTNLTAPSDLKATYRACIERGERLPISFAIGSHPTSFLAATSRRPGDEFDLVATLRGAPLPMVRGVTNGVPAPADAEMIIEGY